MSKSKAKTRAARTVKAGSVDARKALLDAALFGAAMVGLYEVGKVLSRKQLLPMRAGSWYLVEGTTSSTDPTAVRAALLAAGFSDVGSVSLPGAVPTGGTSPAGPVFSRLPGSNPIRMSGPPASPFLPGGGAAGGGTSPPPSSAHAPAAGPSPFAAVARWGGPGSAPKAYPPPIASVSDVQAASPADVPPEKLAGTLLFDPGVTQREAKAVATALLAESSDANLESFGRSFLPDDPMAASYLLLMARSRSFALLYQSHLSKTTPATLESVFQEESRRLGAVDTGVASPGSLPSFNPNPAKISGVFSPFPFRSGELIDDIEGALEDVAGAFAWANDNLGQYGILIPVVWEGITAYRTLESSLVQGRSLEDAWNAGGARSLQNVGHAMRLAAGIVSFWPGLGTVAGVVLNLAAGLALGDDLSGLAIDVVAGAIPGGAIAQAVFVFAANVAFAVIRGETLGQALVDACRAEIVRYCGSDAALAYDAVVRLARGQKVEDDLLDVGRGVVLTYAGQDAANAYQAARTVAQGGGSSASATKAARDLVAHYGGDKAAQAFDAAVAVANGKSLEDVAVDATRQLLYQYQGAEVAHAFDLATAVGKAKALQASGFQTAYTLLRGVDAARRAEDFVEVFAQARAAAQPTGTGVLRLPDGTPFRVTTTSGVVDEVLLERVGMTAAWLEGRQTHLLDRIVRPAVAMLLADTETDPQKILANLPLAAAADSTLFVPAPQSQAEAEALARRNELPGGVWTGPTLAGALVDRGLLPASLLSVEEALACVEIARACVSEMTVTELAPGGQAGYDDLARLGVASTVDPTTGQNLAAVLSRTRVLVHANVHVTVRVFRTAAEELPAWAIQAASREPQGIVQAMQEGSSSYALVSAAVVADARTNPALLASAQAYERAGALFVRNAWVHHYEVVARESSTVSRLQTSNPGSLSSVNAFAVSDARKIAMLEGDDPKTPTELAWFVATFGGLPGSSVAETTQANMRKDLHLAQPTGGGRV